MRPAPIPRRAMTARRAAIQQSMESPTRMFLRRSGGSPPQQYAKWQSGYQDWQYDAKRFARTIGVARFTANLVAQTASRVDLQIERRDGKDWVPVEDDPALDDIILEYRNETLGQGPNDLLRLHTWHYGVAGEGALVIRDGASGHAEYLVVSLSSIEWDRPAQGMATVKLHPAGTVNEGLAFVVPRNQILRFWMPDEEWLAYAVSPMTAGLDDLRRYRSLTRYAQRSAENYLALNGMLWTPTAAHESVDGDPDEDDPAGEGKPSRTLQAYSEWARIGIADDDRMESVVPPMVWWDGEPPQFIDMSSGLDEHGIDHREEALKDWARSVDAPASLVVGGGSSDENHWGAWITQERFIAAVAPTLDRVTHQDMTISFLWPRLRLMGSTYNPTEYRIGYDETNVIVHPDKSDKALRGFLSGLVSADATLREMGFDEADRAGPEDLRLLAGVLGGFAQGIPGEEAPEAPAPDDAGMGGQRRFGPNGRMPGQPPEIRAPGERTGPGTVVEGPPSPTFTAPGARASVAQQVLGEYLPPGMTIGAGLPATGTSPATNGNGHARAAAALNGAKNGAHVMVSLPVPPLVASNESRPDGEAPDDFHMTLLYLGAVDDLPETAHPALAAICAALASDEPMPDVGLSHYERFSPTKDEGLEPCVLVDASPPIYALRERLVQMCEAAGVPYRDDHAFRAHVTVGYYPPGEGPEAGPLVEPYVYRPDALMLHWGDEVTSHPFVDAPEPGALPHGDAISAAARLAYSETQPRDERGRWTSGASEFSHADEITARDHRGVVDRAPISGLNGQGFNWTTTSVIADKARDGAAARLKAEFGEHQRGGWRWTDGTPGGTPDYAVGNQTVADWRNVTLNDVEILRGTGDTAGNYKMMVAHDLAERMLASGVTIDDLHALSMEMKGPYAWDDKGTVGAVPVTISDTGTLDLGINGRFDIPRDHPQYEELYAEAVVGDLVKSWAQTSNDQDGLSLAIQESAARAFGLDTSNEIQSWSTSDHAETEMNRYLDNHGPLLEAFVTAQYDATQEFLAAQGIREVPLERGVDLEDGRTYGSNIVDVITENRGEGGVSGMIPNADVMLRPMSSFALADTEIADRFAGQQYGATLQAMVPAERIVGSWATGNGSYAESEFVVLGGGTTQFDLGYEWNDYDDQRDRAIAETAEQVSIVNNADEIGVVLGDNAETPGYTVNGEADYAGDPESPMVWLQNPVTAQQYPINDPYDSDEVEGLLRSLDPDPVASAMEATAAATAYLPEGWTIGEPGPVAQDGPMWARIHTSDYSADAPNWVPLADNPDQILGGHRYGMIEESDGERSMVPRPEGIANAVASVQTAAMGNSISNLIYDLLHERGGRPDVMRGSTADTTTVISGYGLARQIGAPRLVTIESDVMPGRRPGEDALPGMSDDAIRVYVHPANGAPREVWSLPQAEAFSQNGAEWVHSQYEAAVAARDALAEILPPPLPPADAEVAEQIRDSDEMEMAAP